MLFLGSSIASRLINRHKLELKVVTQPDVGIVHKQTHHRNPKRAIPARILLRHVCNIQNHGKRLRDGYDLLRVRRHFTGIYPHRDGEYDRRCQALWRRPQGLCHRPAGLWILRRDCQFTNHQSFSLMVRLSREPNNN